MALRRLAPSQCIAFGFSLFFPILPFRGDRSLSCDPGLGFLAMNVIILCKNNNNNNNNNHDDDDNEDDEDDDNDNKNPTPPSLLSRAPLGPEPSNPTANHCHVPLVTASLTVAACLSSSTTPLSELRFATSFRCCCDYRFEQIWARAWRSYSACWWSTTGEWLSPHVLFRRFFSGD